MRTRVTRHLRNETGFSSQNVLCTFFLKVISQDMESKSGVNPSLGLGIDSELKNIFRMSGVGIDYRDPIKYDPVWYRHESVPLKMLFLAFLLIICLFINNITLYIQT